MSKPRRIADRERTVTMLDLVRRSYPHGEERMSLSHVVIEEVSPSTGWSGTARWADVLALGVWPSKGLTLDGYEIKASRADLKRELADPTKHAALARYCDTWTLVAWDENVLLDGIPENWGIDITVEGEHGERELQTKRKATVLKPEPWPRTFVCSLVRNAYEQSAGAAYVGRAIAAASQRSYWEGERNGENKVVRHLEPLALAIYGKDRWKWPAEARDAEALCKIAAERLQQEVLEFAAPHPERTREP